ncbi:protein of unknown function [Azospirillum lipoferum 4B]|uniref:Uncharacterized protein n=1 Tax=Azospirillum lipoferum (strain 4B) TaxID=862719 RepID=G7Z5E5_AZOL4|nr:protein of unknown function [Azospirillum lipoferum 4B]
MTPKITTMVGAQKWSSFAARCIIQRNVSKSDLFSHQLISKDVPHPPGHAVAGRGGDGCRRPVPWRGSSAIGRAEVKNMIFILP